MASAHKRLVLFICKSNNTTADPLRTRCPQRVRIQQQSKGFRAAQMRCHKAPSLARLSKGSPDAVRCCGVSSMENCSVCSLFSCCTEIRGHLHGRLRADAVACAACPDCTGLSLSLTSAAATIHRDGAMGLTNVASQHMARPGQAMPCLAGTPLYDQVESLVVFRRHAGPKCAPLQPATSRDQFHPPSQQTGAGAGKSVVAPRINHALTHRIRPGPMASYE